MAHKGIEWAEEDNKGIEIDQLFTSHSFGILAARDGFTIHHSINSVKKALAECLRLHAETARIKSALEKGTREKQVNYGRNDPRENFPGNGNFCKFSCRPFDNKWILYTGKSNGSHYPGNEVMRCFIKADTVGLVIGRLGQAVDTMPWDLAFITKHLTDFNLFYKGNGVLFPLYLYPASNSTQALKDSAERIPNLNLETVHLIANHLGLKFTPEKEENEPENASPVCYARSPEIREGFEIDLPPSTFAPIDILDYTYAVLHSPTYREKYKKSLKTGFPSIPYPKNVACFWQLVKLGGEVRQIHLMESPKLGRLITSYPKEGDNTITRPMDKKDWELYDLENQLGRIWINDGQYFDKVPLGAWEFYIGGYPPAQEWLKSRKGEKLNFEDILHYQKMMVALFETARLMEAIDKILAEPI